MAIFDVWLGRFPSRDEYVAYFRENAEHFNDETIPISRFAEDQGVTFFDHDWIEEYYEQSEDLRVLITPAAYSNDYLDLVIRDARSRNIESANTFVIVEDDQIPHYYRRKSFSISDVSYGSHSGPLIT